MYRHFLTNECQYPKNLKTSSEIDNCISSLENVIKNAIKRSSIKIRNFTKNYTPLPKPLLNLIKEKHNLRRMWQYSRNKTLKQKLNSISVKIKQELHKVRCTHFQNYLASIPQTLGQCGIQLK